MISLKNKKILVTGASSGIGREISIHLSELGAKVVLVARNQENLKETLSLMKENKHKYFCYDLEDISSIKELISKCVSYDDIKFDGFVHCAGIPAIYPLKIMDWTKFEKSIKINTYSYLEIIKYLSRKQYSNNESSIVFLSSILVKEPLKSQSAYISSKISASCFSKVLSLELQKRSIRINNIIVGDVPTKMTQDTEMYRQLKDEGETTSKNIFPIFKCLTPRNISNMAVFLLSNCSKYIIGEDYYMDGGYFK